MKALIVLAVAVVCALFFSWGWLVLGAASMAAGFAAPQDDD